MAKNYVQPGDTITMIAPAGGVVSGGGVRIGDIFGVAAGDAAAGDEFEMVTAGVWTLPKNGALALSAGDRVAWDGSAGEIVAGGSTGDLTVGNVTADALAADPTVPVRLGYAPPEGL